ncbi:MAG: oxygenase MpaB family protein, partial [bacterium]
QFYAESRLTARLFGLPADVIPATHADFRDYMRGMVRGPTLAVGREARAIAAALLRPALPLGIRQAAAATRLFTVGLLPAPIRRRYGYPWGPWQARALDLAAAALRAGAPLLPAALREFPHARGK